jgi:hypothetical protein
LISANPELVEALATNLANIRLMQPTQNYLEDIQGAGSLSHLIESYRGQIEANYEVQST